jgi:prophage antirepressor-like protein
MKTMMMQVSEGLSVTIFPEPNHEFLMTTKDVAYGYDVAENTLRSHFHRHKDEITENKHFVKGVSFCNTLENVGVQPHQIFWTKQGVIRLGFYIKSERAKLFRDWVEELVINYLEKKLPKLPDTPKRKHNRLTQERLLDIMNDVCRIDDKELRLSIASKIMGES